MIDNGFGFWTLEVRIVESEEHTVWLLLLLLLMVAMMIACPLAMMFEMGMQSQITNVQSPPFDPHTLCFESDTIEITARLSGGNTEKW